MRKILLATTAIVALTSVSAMAADVTISGGANLIYSNDDKDIPGAGGSTGSASEMKSEADVNINFSATSDSGISTSMSAGFDEAGRTDDANASISGDFGTIKFVADLGGQTDDSVINGFDEAHNKAGEGTAGVSNGLATQAGESISYTLPSIVDGMTIAVAHTNEDTTESFGYGIAYDAGIAKVQYATISNNTTDIKSANISATVSGLSLGYEQNKTETATTESESKLYGVSYTMDAVTLAYEAGSTKNKAGSTTDDYSQMAVAYSVATGVSLIVTNSEVDDQTSANADVEELEVQLKLSF
jgi:hypothetical protein